MKKISVRFSGLTRIIQTVGLIILAFILMQCKNDVLNDNANPAKFTFLATENAPYNYSENGQTNGLSVDILESLLGKMNHSEDRGDIQIMDWSAAYQLVLNEPCNMMLSMVKTTERDSLFKWVGPIATQKEIVVALKSSGVSVSSMADLNNYSTGVISDDSMIDLLLDQGVMRANILIYDNVSELYTALVDTREIQCIACSKASHDLAVQAMDLSADLFATLYTIHTDDLFFAFNLESDGDMITTFQNNLDSMKLSSTGEYSAIVNRYGVVQHGVDNITAEMVVSLVDRTADDLAADASGTISKINQGLAPYKDQANSALFAFVYDKDVVMVAHAAAPASVGSSSKGLPDVAGIYFRDEIVAGALANGTGWTNYISTKRDGGGLYFMTAYSKLVTGSDSKQYIVCSKRYR